MSQQRYHDDDDAHYLVSMGVGGCWGTPWKDLHRGVVQLHQQQMRRTSENENVLLTSPFAAFLGHDYCCLDRGGRNARDCGGGDGDDGYCCWRRTTTRVTVSS